ncbi:hypothetical protein GCM10027579_12410 [Calidifontibacter terrae]
MVLLANASYLLGIRSNDPLLYHSGLGSPVRGVSGAAIGIGHGPHTLDANDGWTAQALGHLAAQMWSHGNVPLWNVYEGLGQPLAGEMQSAALFLPLVLLQLLPNGIFWLHLGLELIAGFSTLLLLRRLNIGWIGATTGACLFALNGSFSVMTNAPFNPIAFLPLALLGVELIFTAGGKRSRLGFWVTAWAMALMLFSGFPETAYVQGLFIGAWALVRTFMLPQRRRAFLGHVALATLAGVLIALPVLVAFLHFLGFGYVGYHSGPVNNASYAKSFIPTLALKYIAAPMGLPGIGGTQAGYVTLPAVILAIVGLMGARHRALKVLTGLAFLLFVLNMYGFGPAKTVLNHVPGFSGMLGLKYALPVVMFAVALLAAYGLDELVGGRLRGRWVALATAVGGVYGIAAVAYCYRNGLFTHSRWSKVYLTWTVLACLVVVVALLLTRFGGRRIAAVGLIAAAFVVVDSSGTYAVPQLSASPERPVNLGPVRFLQQHLGTSRFYTLGPIQANYGSYFGIAQLNANDLPVPKKYSDFVSQQLTPKKGTPGAQGTARAFWPYEIVPFNFPKKIQQTLLVAYGQQQQHFRDASVEYVVMTRGVGDPATTSKLGLSLAYSDSKVEIWKDAAAKPYYSSAGGHCAVQQQTYFAVTVNCSAADTLTRRAVATPGWTADFGNRSVTVGDNSGLFQTVPVPAGRSTIEFSYLPKFFVAATVGSFLVIAWMLADMVLFWRRRKRPAAAGSRDATSVADDDAALRK